MPEEPRSAPSSPLPAPRSSTGREGKGSVQTVQGQHGGEVLAVGDAGGVGHAGLPQVGPEGGGGDDGAVDGRDLPVVGGQRGGHQHPARQRQRQRRDLRRRARHGLAARPGRQGTGPGPGLGGAARPPRPAPPRPGPRDTIGAGPARLGSALPCACSRGRPGV